MVKIRLDEEYMAENKLINQDRFAVYACLV